MDAHALTPTPESSLGLTVSRSVAGAPLEAAPVFKVIDGYGDAAEGLVGQEVSLEAVARLLGRAVFVWCALLGIAPHDVQPAWVAPVVANANAAPARDVAANKGETQVPPPRQIAGLTSPSIRPSHKPQTPNPKTPTPEADK